MFVYDTTRDSDGGAWRKQTTRASWYNETLNTATRGVRQDFPSRALIVSRATNGNSLTIYDLDDPTCPMWMVFPGTGCVGISATQYAASLAALNGQLYYGCVSSGCLGLLDFISEIGWSHGQNATVDYVSLKNGIANRATAASTTAVTWASTGLANNTVNDIAATVLPLTPLNPLRAGLPNPTIAVATAGGVSVIRADGVVVNSSATGIFTSVAFLPDYSLASQQSSPELDIAAPGSYLVASWSTFSKTYYQTASISDIRAPMRAAGKMISMKANNIGLGLIMPNGIDVGAIASRHMAALISPSYNTGYMPGAIKAAFAESSADVSSLVAATPFSDAFTYANTAALQAAWTCSAAVGGSSVTSAGSGAVMTTDGANAMTMQWPSSFATIVGRAYKIAINCSNTGAQYLRVWVGTSLGGNGLLQSLIPAVAASTQVFTFVATSTTTYFEFVRDAGAGVATITNLSVQLIAADRSVAGNHAVVNGTVTRAAVASGADMAAYGGFSVNNYLEGAAGAIDLALGDFAFMAWVYPTHGYDMAILMRGYYTASAWSGAAELLWLSGGTALDFTMTTNGWTTYDSSIATNSVVGNTWNFIVGIRRGNTIEIYVNGLKSGSVAMSSATGSHTNANATLRVGVQHDGNKYVAGNVALPRVSAFAPTPDQIAAIYAAELPLFQPNAKCLLSGASVQALAYDPDTNQLAVANSTAGTDIFSGLQRVATQASTASTNLLPSAQLPASWTFTRAVLASLPSGVSASAWPGGVGWTLVEDSTASATHTTAPLASQTLANATGYAVGVPLQAGGRGYAKITLSGAVAASCFVNLATGVVSNATNCAGLSPVALGGGFEVGLSFTSSSAAALQITIGAATGTATGNDSYTGTGIAALYFGKPQINLGSTLATYVDGMSNSNNHKSVAFAGGDLLIGTAAGVDEFMASAAGLRETAKRRGTFTPYDPTKAVFYGSSTSATAFNLAAWLAPEGKAYIVNIDVLGVQYGGTMTERDMFVIEGDAYRNIGGNAATDATTRAIKQVTGTTAATLGSDTTNQLTTLSITGKASTTMQWAAYVWLQDAGLQQAA